MKQGTGFPIAAVPVRAADNKTALLSLETQWRIMDKQDLVDGSQRS